MSATIESMDFLALLPSNDRFKVNLLITKHNIQVVSKELVDLNDDVTSRKLEKQVGFLKGAKHPSIVGFEGSEPGTLLMEAMDGTLEGLMSEPRKRLSAAQAVELLRQMFGLINHLKGRGKWVSRLSPRTILSDCDLTQFKIANAYDLAATIPEDEYEKTFAPQVSTTENEYHEASDIYCLGMTCLELAMGVEAFETLHSGKYNNNADMWRDWHENTQESLPSLDSLLLGYPPKLIALLERMVNKNVAERLQCADEGLRSLQELGAVDDQSYAKSKSNLLNNKMVGMCFGLLACALVGSIAIKNFPEAEVEQEPLAVHEYQPPAQYSFAIKSDQPFDYHIENEGIDSTEKAANTISSDGGKEFSLEEAQILHVETKLPVYVDGEKHRGGSLKFSPKEYSGKTITLKFKRRLRISGPSHSGAIFSVCSERPAESEMKPLEEFQALDVGYNSTNKLWLYSDPILYPGRKVNAKVGNTELSLRENGGFYIADIDSGSSITVELTQTVKAVVKAANSFKSWDALSVTCNGKELEPNGDGKYAADIPYAQSYRWEVNSESDVEVLKSVWPNQDEASKAKYTLVAPIEREVEFSLPTGYRVIAANGRTFPKSTKRYSVPFGQQLKFEITDDIGVVKFEKDVEWDSEVAVSKNEFLQKAYVRTWQSNPEITLRRGSSGLSKTLMNSRDGIDVPKDKIEQYSITFAKNGKENTMSLTDYLQTTAPITLTQRQEEK